MRIYAGSRGDVVKGALYMIAFVILLDVVMVLFLQHVAHRTVTVTGQWPVGLLLLIVIAYNIRAFNLAVTSWVRVTPKQLSWASGPKPGGQGLTPSGSIKLSELTAVAVRTDEVKVKSGRKQVVLSVHRLHAEIEGKPTIVLPLAALETAEDKYAVKDREQARKLLLRAVVEINKNVTGFAVDTSAMGEVLLPGDEAKAEAARTAIEAVAAEESQAELEPVVEESTGEETVVTENELVVESGAVEAQSVGAQTVEAQTVEAESVEATVTEADEAAPAVVPAAATSPENESTTAETAANG